MPLLFSYGTLQQPAVQVRTLGRALHGQRDALPGYRTARVAVGTTHHDNLVPDIANDSRVTGMVFEVSEAELSLVDGYELAFAYRRLLVELDSGRQAWVYLHHSAAAS